MADPTYPQLRFPGAGSAPEAEAPEVDPVEQASIDYDVPPNVLRALSEDSGLAPAAAAQRLAGPLRQKRKMREAIAEAMPGSSAADVDRIVGRSLDIAGVPVAKHPLRQAAAGVADVAAGLAAAPSLAMSGDLGGEDATRGKAAATERQAADWEAKLAAAKSPAERRLIREQIETLRSKGARHTAAADAMAEARAVPLGESGGLRAAEAIREGVGDLVGRPDPRDDSFSGQLARGAGQFAGMVPLAILGPVGLGAAGASGVGMTGEQMYREAVDMGADEPTARTAADWGSVLGTTEMLPLSNAFKLLPPSMRGQITSAFLRGVAKVGMQAGEEGVQEFASQVAQNIVAQKLYDPERGTWDGAATAGAIGAILGGGLGVPAGIGEMRRRDEPAGDAPIPQESEPESPITQVATPEPVPAAAAQPASEPLNSTPTAAPAPAGPLSAAVARGPQPALNLPAGAPVTLQTPEGTFTGTLVGEDMHGARVSVEGEEGIISRQEIESGEVRILPAEAAAADIGNPMSESAAPQVDETPVPVDETAPEVADSAPPVTTTPEVVAEPAPAPTPGPVSEAATPAAPAPRPEAPAAPQTAEQARQRLAFIMDQGRTNGWNARLSAMKRDAEETLARLEEQERQESLAADVESVKRATDEQARAAAAAELQPDPLPNGEGMIEGSADVAAGRAGSEAVAPPPDGSAGVPAAEVRASAAEEPAAPAPRQHPLTDVDILPQAERRATNLQFSGKGKWDGATSPERRALVERAGYVGEAASVGREIAGKRWYQVDGRTKAAIVNASREMEAEATSVEVAPPETPASPTSDPGDFLDFTRSYAGGNWVLARPSAHTKSKGYGVHLTKNEYDAIKEEYVLRGGSRDHLGPVPAAAMEIDPDSPAGRRRAKQRAKILAGVTAKREAIEASDRAEAEGSEAPAPGHPAPLYVERKVQNPEAIIAWAREQGFKTTLAPDDMHVTIAFSKAPVDVADAPALADGKTSGPVATGKVKKLGDAVVLAFPATFLKLDMDHARYRKAGASWDFPTYIPHITVTNQPGDVDLEKVAPFRGTVDLGPEVQKALDPEGGKDVAEVAVAAAVEHIRDDGGHATRLAAVRSATAKRDAEIAEKRKVRREIGRNAEGATIFEDGLGVRSIEGGDGKVVSEPLILTGPSTYIVPDPERRKAQFQPVDTRDTGMAGLRYDNWDDIDFEMRRLGASNEEVDQARDRWFYGQHEAIRQMVAEIGRRMGKRRAAGDGPEIETSSPENPFSQRPDDPREWADLPAETPAGFKVNFVQRSPWGDGFVAGVSGPGGKEGSGSGATREEAIAAAAKDSERVKRPANPQIFRAIEALDDDGPAPIRDDGGRFSPREETDDAEVIESDDKASITAKIPESRFVSADALRLHLEADPKLGGVVSKLIESGRVVLHDGPETLPLSGKASTGGLPEDAPAGNLDGRIDAVLGGEQLRSQIVVGATPRPLVALGVSVDPVTISQDVVWKANADKHGLTPSEIKAALHEVYDPLMVFDPAPGSTAPENSFTVLVESTSKGRPVLVAVHMDRNIGHTRVHRIATVHAKDRDAFLRHWLEGGLLAYFDDRKAGSWLGSRGLQLPKAYTKNRRGRRVLRRSEVFKGVEKLSVKPGSWDARWQAKRADARANAQGITTPDGTIHLVASNLNSQTAIPVLLHEAFHAGAEPLIGSEAWQRTMDRLSTIMERNQGEWAQAARQRLAEGGQAGPEEFAAYTIENRAGAPAGLLEVIDRLLGRFKAFMLRRFGAQFGAVTPAQLEAIAVTALRDAGRLFGQRKMAAAMSERAREDAEFAADFLAQLSGVDDLFAFPRTRGRTLRVAFGDIDPSVKFIGDMGEELAAEAKADQEFLLRTGGGKDFFVYQTDDKVWVDVSQLPEGGAGSAIYQAVGDYAHNTGRVFIGDPAGLSDMALRRRTENMLSSAFRHGSTDHLAPHQRQLDGDESLGIKPLRWRDGDTLGNMASLIEASLSNLLHHVPELARARYDFKTRTFRTSSGEPITDAKLRDWRDSFARIGAARAGSRTLKRGILLNSLLRAESGQRPGLLELALRQPGQLVEGGDLSGVLYSIAAAEAPTVTQVDKAERGMIGHLLTKAMSGNYNLLGMVPGRGLFAELAKSMPAGQDYLAFKQEMDAMRHSWHARADEVAQAWRKLGIRGEGNKAMMDLMHESTLAGVDPSKRFVSGLSDEDHDAIAKGRRNAGLMERRAADEERARRHAELQERFKALPEGYRAMFERVRDTYKALDAEQDKVLLENIGKAMDGALRAAERAHEAEIARIRDDGMTGKARDEAIAEADTRLARAKRRQGWGKRAKMADLRKQFETQKLPEPYFPLARFGQFFVTVRDKQSGAITSFERFESPRLQERAAKAWAADSDVTVEKGVLGDDATLKDMVNPVFVADVENILGKAGVDEGVMDAIWQRWLETLPDLSNRKTRIHRKGTAGYSSDAFRAFGDHMFHGAHQLARLKYSLDMAEALDLAEAAAKQAEDPVRAGLVVNEMRKRHAFVMNPKGAPWAQAVTSAAFVYYLAATPAAALVNLSQTAIVGVPVLGGYWGGAAGVSKASGHLMRALRDFAGGQGETWRDTISAANNDRLTADEKAAMEEAYRRSTIDASQAHDLAGVADSGVKYSAARTAIMAKVAWGFHHTERLNREITFLAGYRMAREKGLDHHEAIDKASDLTWRTHFDYQSSSRPRFMQNDAAKVLFVFRNFSVNMIWRLFRDMHQAVNAKDPVERREARTQLIGTTGMMMLSAGITGTWGYGLLMMLAGLFFDDGQDEAEDKLQEALVDALGPTTAGLLLKGVPGHALGISLTDRIGMADLWFRSSDRNLEGEDEYHYWLSQILGAGAGMAETAFRGASMIADGEVYRGVETLLPKAARDLMRSVRYAKDGVTTYKGEPVLDDIDWRDVTKQALGFTPARLTERYERNTRAKNKEQRIMGERSDAMAAYTVPLSKGEKPPSAALQGIADFNAANPDYVIDGKSIKASVSARRRNSDKMEGGIMLNPKIAPRIREEQPPALY